jgi:surface carbohydrate biosynthesis protein
MIGLQAAEHGIPVLLGQMWLLQENLPRLDPGFVLYKGAQRMYANNMRKAKANGHHIGVIDEEAFALADNRQLAISVDPDLFDIADVMFAQGPKHNDALLDRFPGVEDQIVVTGNPRTDLLRPELTGLYQADKEDIVSKYGRFILVNSNFGVINSAWGDPNAAFQVWVNVGEIDPRNESDVQSFKDIYEWEKNNFTELMKVIRSLDHHLTDHTIIVRPHPVEKTEIWAQLAVQSKRIKMVREGPAVPWIMASELLIHTVCTTGMEALLLNSTAISLKAGENPWHQRFVSNFVNHTADDARQALDKIADHFNGTHSLKADRNRYLDVMRTYLTAMDGGFAFEAIGSWITGWFTKHGFTPTAGEVSLPDGFVPEIKRKDVTKAKMSSTLEDLNTSTENLRKAFGRFGNVQGRQVGDSMFLLTRAP